MSRKITNDAIAALIEGRPFSRDNTMVTIGDEEDDNYIGDFLYLHGNPIMKIDSSGVYISTAGWSTKTTKERLNGLSGVRVYHHKKQLYLNDKPWDGKWTKVSVSF